MTTDESDSNNLNGLAKKIASEENAIAQTMANFTDLKGGHNYFEAKRSKIVTELNEAKAA